MPTRIFISHRTDDERIASVFSRNFQRWGVEESEIFQSSNARSGAKIGSALMPQLLQALEEAVLCLWVFTTHDRQEYCAFECTVAMDPKTGNTNTRLAVFQVADEELTLFPGHVFFRNTEKEIRRFVHQFHKEPGFYQQDKAYRPTLSDERIGEMAQALYDDLVALELRGGHQDIVRWDRFTLSLSQQDAAKLAGTGTESGRRELLENAAIVSAHFGSALLHFGYTETTSEVTLRQLVDRWKRDVMAEPYTRSGWVDGICDEMFRAIQNMPARPRWDLMKSPVYNSDWFYPVVNHARLMPDGGFEFDIYMYRLPGALPYVATEPR